MGGAALPCSHILAGSLQELGGKCYYGGGGQESEPD